MYSTYPNGSTLHTEKSHTFKNDFNPFLSFVFHNNWLQNHCWLSLKSIATNFVVVVSVYSQFAVKLVRVCHICAFLLCIFDEEVVPLSGAITDKWVLTLVCGRN